MMCIFQILVFCLFLFCVLCPMLSISQDCPFLVTLSIFSIVYLLPTVCSVSCVLNAVYISGLSILGYPFDFLYRLLTTHSLLCVLCTQCCLYLRIVHSWLPLRCSLSFTYYPQSVLWIAYSRFHISQDCPFLVGPSIVYVVYLLSTVCSVSCVLNVSYIPGLSFIACLFDCLYRLFITYSLFCVLCTQCYIYPRIVHPWLALQLSICLFTIYSLFCVLCTQCYIYPMTVLYCLPL